MKILITGGAGFIGSNLAKACLDAGHSVRVLDNFCSGTRANLDGLEGHLEIHEGDITSPEDCRRACQGIDVISHQAALGSVPRSMLEPELYSWNNLHGFVVLCNQARLAGINKIVYASSSSVYGDSTAPIKREVDRGRPLSPYAASKQGNEDFAQAFHNAYGMTLVGFRYFNVFGPKQNPAGPYAAVIPLFITALMQGKQATIYGDGEQSRDFTHVSNVVQANLRALTQEVPPGAHVVNVACGQRTSVKELHNLIADILGSDLAPIHAPDRRGDIRDSLADVTAARDLLGYSHWTSLREGLLETIEWYRQHSESLA